MAEPKFRQRSDGMRGKPGQITPMGDIRTPKDAASQIIANSSAIPLDAEDLAGSEKLLRRYYDSIHFRRTLESYPDKYLTELSLVSEFPGMDHFHRMMERYPHRLHLLQYNGEGISLATLRGNYQLETGTVMGDLSSGIVSVVPETLLKDVLKKRLQGSDTHSIFDSVVKDRLGNVSFWDIRMSIGQDIDDQGVVFLALINVNPLLRGMGLAPKLLTSALAEYRDREHLNYAFAYARVPQI